MLAAATVMALVVVEAALEESDLQLLEVLVVLVALQRRAVFQERLQTILLEAVAELTMAVVVLRVLGEAELGLEVQA